VTSPDWEAHPPHAHPPHAGPPDAGPPYADQPYPGPPAYGGPCAWPPGYGPGVPQWGTASSPWGTAPYQPAPPAPGQPQPTWGWVPYAPPRRSRRPGPVIAAAVLAFTSAVLVLVGTVYAVAFSALLSLARGPGSGMGPGLTLLHLAVAGLLVVAGLRVLARDRRWLLAAAAVQLALTVFWVLVLDDLSPVTLRSSVVVLPLVYGVLAAVAAGLTLLPDVRAWTRADPGDGSLHPGPPATGG
jgi:hypothetical protein